LRRLGAALLALADGVYRALVDAGPAIGAGLGIDHRDVIHLDGIYGANVGALTASGALFGIDLGWHLAPPT
jgi:hypothetical protein